MFNFNRIKNITDFEKFVEELRVSQPASIFVEAFRKSAGTSDSATVGRIGDYDHGLLYTVQTARKTKFYREHLFTAFQSERGVGDELERNKRIMSVLLAAEKRTNYLRELLPGTLVQLTKGKGEVFSSEDIELLHQQSGEHGVLPAL